MEAQMRDIVVAFINKQVENAITDALLDAFHLPHTSDTERKASVAQLETKFASVDGVLEVVDDKGTADTSDDVITTAGVDEVIGGRIALAQLLESLTKSEVTHGGVDGHIGDDASTANVDESADDTTSMEYDYAKIGRLTQTALDAAVRESAIDIIVPTLAATTVVEDNTQVLVDGKPGFG